MARPLGGKGTRGSRVSKPSIASLMQSLGSQSFLNNQFEGAPVAATKVEFNEIQDAWLENSVSMDYYNPKEYNNLAGQAYEYDTQLSRQFYEVIGLEEYVPGYEGPQNEEDTSPAELTLVPTSTSNPQRPRTVAAGYDEEEEKLTVMFRDGSLYNYYEVDPTEWAAFKSNRSKGAYIYRVLDFKPRGYADQSTMSAKARQAFYRYSRGIQSVKGAKMPGQNKTTYKTAAQASKSRKK